MKRAASLFAALCLVLAFACAGADSLAPAPIFAGMLDRIAFALPAGGCTIAEGETPGVLEDVRQIYGRSGDGEFTLRTANIAGWIEGMRERYPDESLYHLQANTLLQFASMIIQSYGARPTDMAAHDGGAYVRATFRFTYPDTPGVPYEGAAVLNTETGRAVAFYGASGPETSASIAALRFADDEEAAAFAATRVPETLTFGGLTVTFPVTAVTQEDSTSRLAGCLTDGFDYLAVQFFPGMTLSVSGNDKEAQSELIRAAERVILPTIGNARMTESALTRPAPGVAVLTFTCPDPYFGVTNYRCALCVGPESVWYVWSTDTDAGTAFLNSFEWAK